MDTTLNTINKLEIPDLAAGECYIGAIGNAEGTLTHIILLPGDNADTDWQAQMDWAKSIGGDLPNRIEQALMFATARDEFKADWYWSNERRASVAGYAWCQYFSYGYQFSTSTSAQLRARAVRRLSI